MAGASAPEPDPRLDALVEGIIAARGLSLDDAQRALLRGQVERLRAAVATLDAFPLINADEPDFSFAAVEGMDVP